MNFILYSDFAPGISNIVDEELLRRLNGTRYRIGYIPSDSDESRRYFRKVEDQYSKIGISDLFYFDLGSEYNANSIPQLMNCDAIHLSGGDPIQFMSLMKKREFKSTLKAFLAQGKTILGVSAGAMILSKSLEVLACDPTFKSSSNLKTGLNLTDFDFYPHFAEDSMTTKRLQDYSHRHKKIVYACNDDSGLFIQGNEIKCLGHVTKFAPGF